MKFRVCLLSALASLSLHAYASEDYQAYIVNGTEASVVTFPSYVSLFVDLIDYNNTYYEGSYCGATILNDTHILTAAHCVYSTDHDNSLDSLFTVVVPQLQDESYFPSNVTEKQRVSKIYYPDNYESDSLNNDLAILELESSLITISSSDYAILPSETTGIDTDYRDVSEQFYAVGHGNTANNVDEEVVLQKALLTYVENSACRYNNITDTKLCMEGEVSSSNGLEASTCQGDSGGPLYWYNSTEYVQVGLTSFGPSTVCGDPNYSATSVFTEVYDYREWINSVLAGNETAKFTVTEEKRQAYVDSLEPENSSGGGSVSYLFLIVLGFISFVRNRSRN